MQIRPRSTRCTRRYPSGFPSNAAEFTCEFAVNVTSKTHEVGFGHLGKFHPRARGFRDDRGFAPRTRWGEPRPGDRVRVSTSRRGLPSDCGALFVDFSP